MAKLPDASMIRARYDQMWERGYSDLARGDVDVDPVPDDSSQRWGISIIARIPSASSAFFTQLQDQLRLWTGEQHTFYNATNLHATIRSFEFFRSHVPIDDQAVATYKDILLQLAPHFPAFDVTYEGLSANRVGIIVQGYPQTSFLQDFRHALHAQLAQRGMAYGPEADQVRQGAHASIMVFGGALSAPQVVATYISQHRNTPYGMVTYPQLTLVRYQCTAYEVIIVPYAEVVLGLP